MPTLLADWRWSLLAAAAVRLACSRDHHITIVVKSRRLVFVRNETGSRRGTGRCERCYPVSTNADFVPTGGSHEGASNDFSFTCFGSRVGC